MSPHQVTDPCLSLSQPYEINLTLTSVALKLIATLPPVLEPALLQPVVEGGRPGQQTAAEGGGAGQQTLHSVLLKVCAFQCCNALLAGHLCAGVLLPVATRPDDICAWRALTSHINIGIP